MPNKSKGTRRTYLHELSKINKNLDFTSIINLDTPLNTNKNTEQLTLFVAEEKVRDVLNHFQSTYQEFHILTYKIDEAYQILGIMHYLPNPENNIAYEVANLSEYVSGAELTDEEREVIAPDQESDIIDPAEFDIGIFKEEESI
ncbi:hypothetical protein [Paucisalibacillus globulus]|uniref:hypothetical protein n=1 Tax=Paucisalibacillus globulus TaxID=351095 RepID=UPI0004172573|nr:hypothetical protein [Paucisalibacillus globulus]